MAKGSKTNARIAPESPRKSGKGKGASKGKDRARSEARRCPKGSPALASVQAKADAADLLGGDPNTAESEPWRSDTVEARLCRAVDASGITWEGFVSRDDLISAAGLKRKQITPQTIAKAKGLERQWDISAKNRVLENGGSWNGEKKVDSHPEDRIVLKYLAGQIVGPTAIALTLDMKVSEVVRSLNRLRELGKVKRRKSGRFRVAD